MKLLLVDDSATMRTMVRRAFDEGGLPFDEVREAGDGLAALAALGDMEAEGGAPDLVICDIAMPKLDGLKFLSALRGRYAADRLPAIVLTAKATATTEEAVTRLGARLIAKPFDATALCAVAKSMIPHSPA